MINISGQSSSYIVCQLVLLEVNSAKKKVILEENSHFEVPNWSLDYKHLIL